MPTVRCLIPDPASGRMLLLPTDDGWALPTVDIADRPIPAAAPIIADAARRRWGIVVTLLRHLRVGGVEACELELRGPPSPATSGRWVARPALGALPLADADQRLLAAWLTEQEAGAPPTRAPWERRGWLDGAERWIDEQIERLGATRAGPVAQVKAAWPASCVLRVPTSRGDWYAKAGYGRPPGEAALLPALAARWPARVPVVLAADPGRRWLLLDDFGGEPLRPPPDARWEGAVLAHAAFQREAAADIPRWLLLGCPDYRPAAVVRAVDTLLADDEAMRQGEPGGLRDEEIGRLRALGPTIRAMLRRVADLALPATLLQQDFWYGHVVARDGDYLFYDWADTVVGHPFFSLARFLDFVPAEGGWRGRLRAAYLGAWAAFAPMDLLVEAFELVRRLHQCYLALYWQYLERPYLEPGTPFAEDLAAAVIRALRELLLTLGDGNGR